MTNSNDTIINPLTSLMGYQLRRASITMMVDLRTRLKPLGITPTLSTILIIADKNDNVTQSSVSRILSIKRANMVPLVSSLESDGYLRKEAIDGRSQNLVVTSKGEKLLTKVYKHIDEHESHFREIVSPKAADLITKALPQIWDNED